MFVIGVLATVDGLTAKSNNLYLGIVCCFFSLLVACFIWTYEGE